jgi:tRNA(Ile2)-agmatinylcytidine synthase
LRCLVGLDDTDSRLGHCTTHLGYRAVDALLSQGCTFVRYPRLVRLNPNIPFKTRGNAAICLDFQTDRPEAAFGTVESLLRELSDVENGANSGAVFATGDTDQRLFRQVYRRAVSGVVGPGSVARVLKNSGVSSVTLGNGMGLVGATASLGFSEEDDHTYELIAYRRPESCGTPRVVDPDSVMRAERELFPHVFNSYDYGARRTLVAPHGPDPVFVGVRAASPLVAMEAFGMLSYGEKLAGHMVYVSNQCTDAHLSNRLKLPLSAYSAGWLSGTVGSVDRGDGGHVYISLVTEGCEVTSAVYEPAGDLVRMASRLATGDRVTVFGGVRRRSQAHPAIVNVEKLEVLSVAPRKEYENPACPECGRRTKSEGRGKGFQCPACGMRLRGARKKAKTLPREIQPGVYLPSPGAQRHLTKQLVRYGREVYAAYPVVDGWFRYGPVRPLRVPAQSRR